jgi:hypothetical protein
MRAIRGVALALCLGAAAQLAPAQNLMGKWVGATVINGERCSFTMTITAGNHYVETAQAGTLMTMQSGTFVLANGLMMRKVLDWSPKQQVVMDPPTGSHAVPVAKPPGGSFRVTFPNTNTMVLEDVNLKGTLTYQRVQ